MKHRAGHNGLGFATFSLRAIYEWDFSGRGSGRASTGFPSIYSLDSQYMRIRFRGAQRGL